MSLFHRNPRFSGAATGWPDGNRPPLRTSNTGTSTHLTPRKGAPFWGIYTLTYTLTLSVFILWIISSYYLWHKTLSLEQSIRYMQRDDTALQDFAWRYNGARIVGELTTKVPDEDTRNSPFVAIDGNLKPGLCWPLGGSAGQLGIRFSSAVRIFQVTIDHIPKELTSNITNSPRNIKIWGYLERLHHPPSTEARTLGPPISSPNFTFVSIADLEYDVHAANHIQTFSVMSVDVAFHGIVAQVLNNWGGHETCLYRVRVHGQAV